jgi:uncharacterized protein (DUF3084 family)
MLYTISYYYDTIDLTSNTEVRQMTDKAKTLLINAMRTYLSRQGVSGVSNQEILEVIESINNSFELSDDEKSQVKAKLVEKFKPQTNALTVQKQVTEQAQNLSVELNQGEIATIANIAQNQANFIGNQISVIQSAILDFVDRQHQQKQEDLAKMLANVNQYSETKNQQFENQLGGELQKFFQTSNSNFGNCASSISAMLAEYKGNAN